MTPPSPFQLFSAPVTAFAEDGSLDLAATRALFAMLRGAGVDGLFTPGTTGEFTALDDDERLAVIEAALEEFGPEHVIAHVGAASTRQTVRIARAAARSGVTRMAAITPFYYAAGEAALLEHYRRVTDAAPSAAHYVYVFPARTGTAVPPATLAQLAGIPGIVGAKVSGLSLADNLAQLGAVPPGFELYSGNDLDIVRLAQAGAAGVVSGVSNVFPELFARVTRTIAEGGDAGELQPAVDAAVAATAVADIGLLKAGLAARGLAAGTPRVSIDPPGDERLRLLRSAIDEDVAKLSRFQDAEI